MGERTGAAAERGKWLALTAALLGWLFDGFEMGLFPLVARPALHDLLGRSGATVNDDDVSFWFSMATSSFLVGAATGGVVFGWLGDRVGRVRAMTLSILTYSLWQRHGRLRGSRPGTWWSSASSPRWAWAASGRWASPW